MLAVLAAVLIAGVLVFGFVVFFGAPYLPTFRHQIVAALDLLDLKPGQTMLEIGSGDGRVLRAAAERGIRVIGYEINPILVIYAKFRTRKYGKNVKVIWGDAFAKKWPITDGVFVFGLDRLMPKVHKKIVQSGAKNVKLVSVAFQLPEQKPMKENDGVFLYEIK